MTDDLPQPAEATPQAPRAARVRRATKPRKSRPGVVLRFIGDGSVYQSGIPNRDVIGDDNLPDELLELAVATGTHERV